MGTGTWATLTLKLGPASSITPALQWVGIWNTGEAEPMLESRYK